MIKSSSCNKKNKIKKQLKISTNNVFNVDLSIGCKYVLQPNIRVNAFCFSCGMHHCSPLSLLRSHLPRIYCLQTPSPGPAFAVKWWGIKPRKAKIILSHNLTHQSLPFSTSEIELTCSPQKMICLFPFAKMKCNMFGNWSISTRDLLPSKIMNFKKYTLFIKKNHLFYST